MIGQNYYLNAIDQILVTEKLLFEIKYDITVYSRNRFELFFYRTKPTSRYLFYFFGYQRLNPNEIKQRVQNTNYFSQ